MESTAVFFWDQDEEWMYHLLGHPKRKRSYSNHPFSGAFAVSLREGTSIVSCFRLNAHLDVSKNRCTPKSSILIWFSLINHPFGGTPIFGNIHLKRQRRFDVFVCRQIFAAARACYRSAQREWGRDRWDQGWEGHPDTPRRIHVCMVDLPTFGLNLWYV